MVNYGEYMAVKILNTLKTLAVAYFITVLSLLLVAFLLYRFRLTDVQTTAAIFVIYVLSSFVGGFMLARLQKKHRVLWGLCFGIMYFAVLAAVSIIIGKGVAVYAVIRALVICAVAGAAGAFATPG
jgi:putative membrane protein (TIGR04086 family)